MSTTYGSRIKVIKVSGNAAIKCFDCGLIIYMMSTEVEDAGIREMEYKMRSTIFPS
jgi:hypothetical protein